MSDDDAYMGLQNLSATAMSRSGSRSPSGFNHRKDATNETKHAGGFRVGQNLGSQTGNIAWAPLWRGGAGLCSSIQLPTSISCKPAPVTTGSSFRNST
jgi:hypothetical protein